MGNGDTSPANPNRNAEPPAFVHAEQVMAEGNRQEDVGSAEALEKAIRCYRAAFDVLHPQLAVASLPLHETRRRLGLARMNEGNAWMKRLQFPSEENCIQKATTAYEAAISWLEGPEPGETAASTRLDARDQNTLGAAWMNLGHALHTRGDLTGIERAIRAFDASLGWLRALPLDESEWYRLNLAGAEINSSNVLLSHAAYRIAHASAPPFAVAQDAAVRADLIAARENAQRGRAALNGLERIRPDAADLALKGFRAQCDALGELLPRTGANLDEMNALGDEATDTADAGLALYRAWPQYAAVFEPIALRLYRFGSTVYRIHQPHFLAEFLEENGNLGAKPWREIAREAATQAQAELKQVRQFTFGDRDSERRLETARSLQEIIQKYRLNES